jgi:hypothetical protein
LGHGPRGSRLEPSPGSHMSDAVAKSAFSAATSQSKQT